MFVLPYGASHNFYCNACDDGSSPRAGLYDALPMEPLTLFVLVAAGYVTVQQSLWACIQCGLARHYKKCDEEFRRERLPGWAKDLSQNELEAMIAAAEGPPASRTLPA